MAKETSRFSALKQLRNKEPEQDSLDKELTAAPTDRPGSYGYNRDRRTNRLGELIYTEAIPKTTDKPPVSDYVPSPKRGRPKGKRSNPDFEQTTLFLKKDTKRAATRLLEDKGSGDLSMLTETLLAAWVKRNS